MKKIINTILVISLFWMGYVNAANNKLYFTESNDRLYYDSKLEDGTFMNHQELIPGSMNEDVIIIENGTNTDYTLYLKLNPKSNSDGARELFSNIKMKVYLDDNLIYDGIASGTDYNDNGINLQNATKIGSITKKKSYTLKVLTTLDKEYSNTDNNENSLIDWTFYAEYNDEVKEIVKTPITGKNNYIYIVCSLILIALAIIFIIISKKKK